MNLSVTCGSYSNVRHNKRACTGQCGDTSVTNGNMKRSWAENKSSIGVGSSQVENGPSQASGGSSQHAAGSSQTEGGSSQGGGFSSQAVGVSSQGGSGSSQVVAESSGQKKVKRAKRTVTWFNP
ncbi:hypothetical protein Tco_0328360 [Tanacetum coccineum]